VKALDKLQGMFAFAFYSPQHKSIILARDPLGIKPLYVASSPKGHFLFASEVRPLLATRVLPDSLDLQGLASCLAFGAVQGSRTLFRSIRSFPAGCWQEIYLDDTARIRLGPIQNYWSFPEVVPVSEPLAVDQLRAVLSASVNDHLISDVPLGVFLSSGMDSSIVAWLAKGSQADVRTFCVGFPDHETFSETKMAQANAERIGVRHTNVLVTESEALESVTKWLNSLDQPSMDGTNVYVISQAVRGQGIKVALSGQGGDELFGGYSSFLDLPKSRNVLTLLRIVPPVMRNPLLRFCLARRPVSFREKALDMADCDGSPLSLYLQRRRLLSNRQMGFLGLGYQAAGLTPDYLPPEAQRCFPQPSRRRFLEDISVFETHFYMGNTLLRDGDTNGMAHGLEIRVPFLDKRVIDLAFTLPAGVRFPSGRPPKHLLREAFADIISVDTLAQTKRGFILPIARWMCGSLRGLCEEGLAHLRQSSLVEPSAVDAIWTGFLEDPTSTVWSRAWLLCVLGHYLKNLSSKAVGQSSETAPFYDRVR